MNMPRKTCAACGVMLDEDEQCDGICEDCRTEPTDLESLLAVALAAGGNIEQASAAITEEASQP